MTIGRGAAWGDRVAPPSGMIEAHDDAAFVRLALGPPPASVRLTGGDLARTVGAASARVGTGSTVLALPVDLLELTTDIGDFTACAHVVARPPWSRGGPWFGALVVVMNVQFIGDWDVAPRGHPNDGRAEVLQIDGSLPLRQRLAVRRRLPLGTHVPHPGIATRSVRDATFEFRRPMVLRVDGVDVGAARSMAVHVHPDALIAYA
jgi:hypothetical protein